jgi:hypothetical protein
VAVKGAGSEIDRLTDIQQNQLTSKENEGLGTSQSGGLRRGRDGTQVLPFDARNDAVAVATKSSSGPLAIKAVVSLPA